ncbi:MAG TPA: hypothetical protein VJT31_00430 [Rugosimonospora sp.]|nr:hypothetical protein [Rugosimonospora sp.]
MNSDIWESYLPSNWRVGDCTMLANYTPADNRSFMRIVRPDSTGHTNVYVFEATETAASPTDVWWTTLTFYTAFGTPILTTPKIAGAQMTSTNQIYLADAWAGSSVIIDPQFFPLIAYVQWDVSC